MSIFKRKKKIASAFTRKSTFDINEKHEKLKLFIIFLKRGHGGPTNQLLLDCGVSMSVLTYGNGTKERYVSDVFGSDEKEKDVVIAMVPEKKYLLVQERLLARFQLYPSAQGVVLVFDLKSLAGILAYKFLTDYEGGKENGNKESSGTNKN